MLICFSIYAGCCAKMNLSSSSSATLSSQDYPLGWYLEQSSVSHNDRGIYALEHDKDTVIGFDLRHGWQVSSKNNSS